MVGLAINAMLSMVGTLLIYIHIQVTWNYFSKSYGLLLKKEGSSYASSQG